MTQDLEERLIAAADRTIEAPDPHDFLDRLHRTLTHRRKVRQTLAVTVTTAAAVLITTLGLFQNLRNSSDQDYLVYDEFALFSDIGETDTIEVDWADPSLVLEALNYLIQEADLMGNGWKTVETLDQLGYIDFQSPSNSEG
ncbi:MAG: hypothetical protein ACE5HZ_04945 [Fidelibacterota bacterium]